MLTIITNNPFRILGVYSNCTPKDVVANKSKINAFTKVGKAAAFPVDMTSLAGPVDRSAENIQYADSSLTVPKDKLVAAQFWFLRSPESDSIISDLSRTDDVNAAAAQWGARSDMYSMQNAAVAMMIKGDYAGAAVALNRLYKTYRTDFLNAIGINPNTAYEELVQNFVSTVLAQNKAVDIKALTGQVADKDWTAAASAELTGPLLNQITDALTACKATKEKTPAERLAAGRDLARKARMALIRLGQIMPRTDPRYTSHSDKVANEVLQCGIDYYNALGTYDAAKVTLEMIEQAKSFACGPMVKQRIEENSKILQGNLSDLAPSPAQEEEKAVEEAVCKARDGRHTVADANALLFECGPLLSVIGVKTGTGSFHQVNRSSQVANTVMNILIDEVNAKIEACNATPGSATLESLKKSLNDASSVLENLKRLNMDEATRKRLNENITTVSNMLYNAQQQQTQASASSDGGKGCLSKIGTVIGYIIVYALIMALLRLCN